jgi:hypothetical protein
MINDNDNDNPNLNMIMLSEISSNFEDDEINKEKKRKLNISSTIPPWREEMILFIEQFKKIIKYNIYDQHKDNYMKAKDIINSTNFFDILDDLPVVMPIIYRIVKNNDGIKRYIVYITVLFLYYGLILFDQTNDYLCTSDIKNFFKINDEEFIKIYDLILEISCSNKEYASVIRRKLFYIDN